MKFIIEDYLDDDKQFYDFRTRSLTDEVVFDQATTGTSYYNDFINNPDYMRKDKNLKSEIVWMTPKEYFEGCADIFNSTLEKQISQTKADKNTFNHLMTVLKKYKRTFPIGFLNYADKGQEGRHRMLVAAEYSGWDVKQPVLVINWADEELAARRKKEKEISEANRKIEKAVDRALKYEYSNIEELENQLQWELNSEYVVLHGEPDIEFSLSSDDSTEQFIVKCGVGEYTFSYSDVKFVDKKDDEDDFNINWEELDLEDELGDMDIDDWLKKKLGESWSSISLTESIEKHDTLNPLIWEGETLRSDVRTAILEIVNKYIEDSEVLSLEDVIDIELLGSNASYNYTKDSDLDIHLVVNMEMISSDPALVQIACNAEKALFNKAYEITIKGIEIELYVEDVKAGAVSNGVFSVSKNEWIKMPVPKQIPDIKEDEEYLGLLDAWMIRAKKACNSDSRIEVMTFINDLYNLRRISIMTDGEYALGNLVFKEIRNHGLLQELKDSLNKLASKELSLESLQ